MNFEFKIQINYTNNIISNIYADQILNILPLNISINKIVLNYIFNKYKLKNFRVFFIIILKLSIKF